MKQNFLDALRVQRWDDHRYYHHSTINQSLHLVSALSFLTSYVVMFRSPAAAAMIGWLFSMATRQAGHFFFEPRGYDAINQASHEYKEAIKVGYNLRRKIWLIAVWLLSPLLLHVPGIQHVLAPIAGEGMLWQRVGRVWFAIGVGGLIFRTVQLMIIRDVQTGLVWMTKILTDPFHDVKLYYRSPYYLLRGELLDPMTDAHRA